MGLPGGVQILDDLDQWVEGGFPLGASRFVGIVTEVEIGQME